MSRYTKDKEKTVPKRGKVVSGIENVLPPPIARNYQPSVTERRKDFTQKSIAFLGPDDPLLLGNFWSHHGGPSTAAPSVGSLRWWTPDF